MRRRADDNDSTELLLDTICNCLGAVLFIVLLIVLMVSQHSAQATVSTPRGQAELRERKLAAELALDQLSRRKDNLDEALRLSTESGDSEQYRAEKVALIQAIEEHNRLVESARADAVHSKTQVNEKLAEQERLMAKLAGLKADLTRLDERIAESRKGAQRKARLPRVRATSKSLWPAIIMNGRLYPIYAAHGGGYNEADLDVRNDGIRKWFTPKAGKGIKIAKGNRITDDATARLKGVPGRRFYVCVWVYPDSYGEALLLRDELLRLGIQYNWRPMTPAETLAIGPGPGGNWVQ